MSIRKITIVFIAVLYLMPIHTRAANDNGPQNLLTQSAVLMDANSGQVLYEKNGNEPMYPASLTKIATAIYALEKGNIDELVTVSENARQVEGTRVYLEIGEQVSLLKLIKGLLINSGNDAGVAIAEHMEENMDNFEVNINEYLKNNVGLENTYFSNPHGLFNSEHKTTAYDLAKLTQYAMKNELFGEIIGTTEMPWIGQAWETTLYHHHKMMREMPYEGITGGKTGFVDESGHTLMTTAERDNLSLIVITMNGSHPMDTYSDTTQLLDYGFATFDTKLLLAGSEYEDNNGDVFRLMEDQYVTTYKNKDVQARLSDEGTLLVNEGDELLQTVISLEKETQKSKLVSTSDEIEDVDYNDQPKKSIWASLFFILLFIFIGLVGWLLVDRWRKR